jgi:predicted secreted protein
MVWLCLTEKDRNAMTRSIASLALAAGLTAFAAAPAWAQKPDMSKLAEFGGQMHAAAQSCGDHSAADLEKMKAQQKAASEQQGLSASDFESGFNKGLAAGMAKFKGMSAADKAKTCEQLNAMTRMQPPAKR